jgi:LysM repeat protein
MSSAPPVFLTKEAKGGMNYEIGVYVVQTGDNLTLIAHRHQTTLKELRRLNPELVSDAIQVGQQLRVYEKASR